MQLKERDLQRHLESGPARAYLVSGDEPLLVAEAADMIRGAIAAAGASERERHHVESGFDWNALRQGCQSMSLFGDVRLIELHLSKPSPGDAGSKTIAEVARGLDADHLLVVAPRLDRAALRAAWVKAIDEVGVSVPIWPIDRAQLPRWLAARARRLGIQLPNGGVEALVEATEGNLLAASQELEKLRLLGVGADWSVDRLHEVLADASRFEGVAALDAAFLADGGRALRILRTQRDEGANLVALVAQYAGEIRRLGPMLQRVADGDAADAAMGRAVHFSRRAATGSALTGLRERDRRIVVRALNTLDAAAKGALGSGDDPWRMLERVLVRIAATVARRGRGR